MAVSPDSVLAGIPFVSKCLYVQQTRMPRRRIRCVAEGRHGVLNIHAAWNHRFRVAAPTVRVQGECHGKGWQEEGIGVSG